MPELITNNWHRLRLQRRNALSITDKPFCSR
jgi:hypothetical protein